MKRCRCVEKLSKLLEKDGDELDLTFIRRGRAIYALPIIATSRKIGVLRRRGKKTLVPSHCPFCGQEYPQL